MILLDSIVSRKAAIYCSTRKAAIYIMSYLRFINEGKGKLPERHAIYCPTLSYHKYIVYYDFPKPKGM